MMERLEARLCLAATATLSAGAAVYPCARGSHPLWPALAAAVGSLPTLLHTIGFTLLALAVCAPWPRLAPRVCIAACLFEWAFEVLQAPALAGRAPLVGLARLPLLGVYLHGTFDPADLGAAAAGALLAFAIAHYTARSCRAGSRP